LFNLRQKMLPLAQLICRARPTTNFSKVMWL